MSSPAIQVAAEGTPMLEAVERTLVERALAGDGQAFAALVRPHLPVLSRVAARSCRNPALAEDAVQEALTIAYEQLSRYTPGTSLRAHLISIVVRRAHTLVRSEGRRGDREKSAPRPGVAADAHAQLEHEEQARMVRMALAEMPEKRREAAILRLDGELSFAEIATILETTEGSARVLVHLALKELRVKLAALLEGKTP